MAKKKLIGNEATQFQPKGVGCSEKQPPVSVKLPVEIDAIVRSLDNRSEFIRAAIIEKLQREGLLPVDN
ncbi:MAG: hypothetical protein EAZ09_18970 [Oscillatoriales cyanobacterium]|nr:MAG: hypothetical protein EAZ18_17385 [Oscillatoriales cyanobacterium]TAH18099.1 MAG: hypothetical protein EAZ09_18970 [Oscillatoriales cyanobacterium]